MKIGQYCQRQRCKDVESEQFLACIRVARVCQRQLGFLVIFIVYYCQLVVTKIVEIITTSALLRI